MLTLRQDSTQTLISHKYKLCLSIILALFIFSPLCYASNLKQYRVLEVNDGDTVTLVTESILGFKVKSQKARLIGIDAPELKQEPWGKRAKNHLQKLIKENGGVVLVEFDVDKTDKYGRWLVYLRDKKDNLINEQMVLSGYAVIYTIPPNVKYSNVLYEAQQKARASKRGIWSKGGLKELPSEFRQKNPR